MLVSLIQDIAVSFFKSNLLFLGFLITILVFTNCNSENPSSTSIKKDVYDTSEMAIQHGMELFNKQCASCHNFSEKTIGPNLSGITSIVDKKWLISFITDAPTMIERGDKRSVELFEEYKQYMPAFPALRKADMEDILGFIHKYAQGEKRNKNNRTGGLTNPIPETIPTSDLTLVIEEQFKVPGNPKMTPITRINQMSYGPEGRLFINDLRGKLIEINENYELSTFMDISKLLPHFIDSPGKGSGFGSWAFHPDYINNGLFYTTHTEAAGNAAADYPLPDSISTTLQSILLEWKSNDPTSSSFEGSHRELLRVDMVSGGHTFQHVTFNPLAKLSSADHGMLYLGIGDGSAALRGYSHICNSNEYIWGSVIRIDPLGNNSKNGKYGIPIDNPFVDSLTAVKEVWANGFRNPHKIVWDETGTGKMLITNIGQHSLEEVNLGIAGANYGWPNREGTFLFDVDANVELVYPLPHAKDNYTYPVAQYDHDEGSAISGGFVYAGSQLPILRGKYIFGDMSRGWLYYSEIAELNDGQQATIFRLKVSIDGNVSNMEDITKSKRVDLRIGIDSDRELYLFSKGNGAVYKIVGCESNST